MACQISKFSQLHVAIEISQFYSSAFFTCLVKFCLLHVQVTRSHRLKGNLFRFLEILSVLFALHFSALRIPGDLDSSEFKMHHPVFPRQGSENAFRHKTGEIVGLTSFFSSTFPSSALLVSLYFVGFLVAFLKCTRRNWVPAMF